MKKKIYISKGPKAKPLARKPNKFKTTKQNTKNLLKKNIKDKVSTREKKITTPSPKETFLVLKMEGKVIQEHSNCFFSIQLKDKNTNSSFEDNNTSKDGRIVLGYLSGKLRRHFRRVEIGDMVLVEISLYDTSRARVLSIIK